MVVGVWTILMPASGLPHAFGYYAVVVAFLFGLRFGFRALGMLLICCVAIGVGDAVGRGSCTTSSSHYRCAFEAAAPILIFGYLIGATIAGALLSGFVAMSTVVRESRHGAFRAPRDRGSLLVGHTVVVAMAAAAAAFVGFAALPLHGAPLFLPSVAACVALGLAPSYADDAVQASAAPSGAPTW